jgi:integrase
VVERCGPYDRCVGSFHMREPDYLEFTCTVVNDLEKAHKYVVEWPRLGISDFGLCLLRATHVLQGMRLHNGPLSDLPLSIGHDGKVLFPKDKIVSALHATRPGLLPTVLRYYYLEYFLLRERVVLDLKTEKGGDKEDSLDGLTNNRRPVELEDPEDFFFRINCVGEILPFYRSDILRGMPIAIQHRDSELRSQLCRFLEEQGAPQAVKDAILGHSTEMSALFGEDKWWNLREFSEVGIEYLDRYATYLGFPEIDINESNYEMLLRNHILSSPVKKSKPIRKAKEGTVITVDEFKSKVRDLCTMLGSNSLEDDFIVAIARKYAGSNLNLMGKLLRSVGSNLPRRDAARLNRQRSNLEHDHGLDVFVRRALLADFVDRLFIAMELYPVDELEVHEIASLGEILFFTECGIANASLGRTGYESVLDNPVYIHKSTTTFFVFTGGKNVQPGRMTHQVMIGPGLEKFIVVVRQHATDGQLPSAVIKTRKYRDSLRDWFSRAGFEEKLSVRQCFEKLVNLLRAEVHYSIIPMIRDLYKGDVISTPLPIEDYYACCYTTRRASPEIKQDNLSALYENRRAVLTLIASRQGDHEIEYSVFKKSVRKIVSEAGERAGSDGAPKFRCELSVGIFDYLSSLSDEVRLALPHRIVLIFLSRVSEVGIRGTKKKKRIGKNSSIDRFLTEILPVIFHVYADCSECPPEEDKLPDRFREALSARPDREYAEPIIDLCLDYLEESDFLEHPGKHLVYSGEKRLKLGRAAYVSKPCFVAVLFILYKEPDPSIRYRRILLNSILYRFGNRFSEGWALRSLNIELSPVGDCISVIARGEYTPKTTAGNRWTMRFSALTEIEEEAYKWLKDMRLEGMKAVDFVFRAKDRRVSWLDQQREQAYLGHVLRVVSGNPNRCLYDLRHTFAANLVLGLYVNADLTTQLKYLMDDRWHESFTLPEEIMIGGKRFMHAAEAIKSQMGHTDVRVVIFSYFPFSADLYHYYWGKRTVRQLTLGSSERFLSSFLSSNRVLGGEAHDCS